MDAGKTTFACNGSEPLVEEHTGHSWTESFDDVESGRWIVENSVDEDFEVSQTERGGFGFIEVTESSDDDGLQSLKKIVLGLGMEGNKVGNKHRRHDHAG